MIAALKSEKRMGFEFREIDTPRMGKDEIFIKNRVVSICGTDLSIYKWNGWAAGRIRKIPLVIGHELSGEIVDIGSDVEGFDPGDNVSAETHIFCDHCPLCKNNMRHVCENLEILGVDRDGCFCEYTSLPSKNAWKNDTHISPDLLSIQEPLGNAVDTVLSESVEGKKVSIFGCGPIGLMMITVAKNCGASEVYASDASEYRLKIAKNVGADRTVNVLEENEATVIKEELGGIDVACEASGNESALKNALNALVPCGRISLLGLFPGQVSLDLTDEVIFKGIRVYGITGRRIFETWYKVSALLPRLNLSPIITHRLRLEELERGFELMLNKECGKVIMEV